MESGLRDGVVLRAVEQAQGARGDALDDALLRLLSEVEARPLSSAERSLVLALLDIHKHRLADGDVIAG